MKTVINKFGIVLGCMLGICLPTPAVWAKCSDANGLVGKMSAEGANAKAYVQYEENIGTSWRLYLRPRNGACLLTPAVGYQSPTETPGLSSGDSKSVNAQPGSKNCDDGYKSYVSVDIPSASDVYKVFTAPKTTTDASGMSTTTMSKQPTLVGFKILTTKNDYSGVFAITPMQKADGSLDAENTRVVGICFK